MERLRWIIFGTVLILIITVCKLNWHQRHFNFFILGLFLLNYVVIVVFWLTCKWQRAESEESMKEYRELPGPG